MTIDRRTSDPSGNHRRTGLLRELGDRQSEVKELLNEIRATEDKTLIDGLAGNLGYGDDKITAVALCRIEMSSSPDREVEKLDLIWAGEFLDHLDTQGFTLRRKARV